VARRAASSPYGGTNCMGTPDYWDPLHVVNFRDAGAFVNLIAKRVIVRENRLFRGGTIGHIADTTIIGSPATILCLKKGAESTMRRCSHAASPPPRWWRGTPDRRGGCRTAREPASARHCHYRRVRAQRRSQTGQDTGGARWASGGFRTPSIALPGLTVRPISERAQRRAPSYPHPYAPHHAAAMRLWHRWSVGGG
jgi:hypothetical protein